MQNLGKKLLLYILWMIILGINKHVIANGNKSSDGNQKHLRTSSLLTCMENSEFTATYFDVKYYPFNQSFVFKIDAISSISDNVTLKAEIITYGITVIEHEFDLCSLNEAALCPLSTGRINVMSTYQLKNNELSKKIPQIAYRIPDLDAQVRVLAYKKSDKSLAKPVACVQAFLSNDKTVQTKYAAWPIAAVSGVGILTSGFVSIMGYSSTAAHIASNSISLFVYFQNLAITAMMGVARVPPIAASWTQNFQWSMGIIRAEFMQKILNWYVQATKGVSTVVLKNKDILSISVQKRDYNFDLTTKDSSLYTSNERNTTRYATKILVLRGMERVAYKANIELSNLFLTGIVFLLFFISAVVVGMIFFKALIEVLTRARIMAEASNFFIYRKNWGNIIKGALFRISIIAFPQVSLFCIWEFTQRDSPAVLVDSVVLLFAISGLLTYGTMRVLFKGKLSQRLYKNPAYLLFGDGRFLNRYGFLYSQFHADKYWWLFPLLSYGLLRSLFVAVLQNHGKTQAVIIFVIELFYFVALCCIRPYLDKSTNLFNIAIHFITLINAVIFLFFSDIFQQPVIVSSIMAIVLFVLNAVFALFLLLFTLVTCSLALLRKNPDSLYQPLKDDRVSFIPRIQVPSSSNLLLADNKIDSDSELSELRKAAMDTNEELEKTKILREDAYGNNINTGIIFDDASSTHSSLLKTGIHLSSRARSSADFIPEPLQPNSAVMGFSAVPSSSSRPPILKNATRPNGNPDTLQKPGTSFYSHPKYSNSRTYL